MKQENYIVETKLEVWRYGHLPQSIETGDGYGKFTETAVQVVHTGTSYFRDQENKRPREQIDKENEQAIYITKSSSQECRTCSVKSGRERRIQ